MAKPPYESEREPLRRRFLSEGDAAGTLAEHSRLAERIVREAWDEHLAAAFPSGLCLAAVGGFGRRELFPHSDVDLLLVSAQPLESSSALAAFVGSLWDRGLRPSHGVRTPAECCRLEPGRPESCVSLLDRRYLAGDQELYARLDGALARWLRGERLELARSLCRGARARHARFGNAVQQLEPDVKESPGGLRDLHLARWLERLEEAPAPVPSAPAPEAAPWSLLSRVRCFLHYRSGRDDNRLSFEAQEELLEQGFARWRDPGELMRDYYRSAREVWRRALGRLEAWEGRGSSLWIEFRAWRARVSNAEFSAARALVWVKAPSQFERDLGALWRLFEFAGRHGLPLARETERRVEALLPRLRAAWAQGEPLWPPLARILALPRVSPALRAMHQTGVLKTLLPEWGEADCLPIRDDHHRYTVDEHTLRSLESLEELPRAADPLRRRLAGLLEEAGDPTGLRLALLFHDLGKARALEAHTPHSAGMAAAALGRIQAPPELIEHVCRLIERHLDLSELMHSRDPEDPATAQRLAQRGETLERLRELTLLTYADSSAVHPGGLSAWRGEQLWRLYLAGVRQLTRELQTERLPRLAAPSPQLAAFLEGLPARYLRAHSEKAAEADLRLCEQALKRGAAAELAPHGGYWSVRLAVRDRPGLAAALAGALTAFGLNILRAEAYSNRQGMALETFAFEDPHRTLELNPGEAERLRVLLERAALGRADVARLLANRPPPLRPSRRARIEPAVSFDSGASPDATLVEIVAEDRPGLLYELAQAFTAAGCNLEVLLADTKAHRAFDVFYVTAEGRPLTPSRQAALREKLLAACRPQTTS